MFNVGTSSVLLTKIPASDISPVTSLSLKDVVFFSVPSLPIILIPEAILDPVSNLEGFFISGGFSLVPPALQLALLFFYSGKLSFHAGESHSASKSHVCFLAFLK